MSQHSNIIKRVAQHITKQQTLTESEWKQLIAATDAAEDAMGQWRHPGRCTVIPSNHITMRNVPYKVIGFDDTGHAKMMHPEEEYVYPGNRVFEIPLNGQQQTFLMQLRNQLRSWREL